MGKDFPGVKNVGGIFRQYKAAATASLGAVCGGSVLAWTSPVLPQLIETDVTNSTIKLTESEAGLVGSFLAIGALVSAIPSGFVADRIGRKNSILLFTLPFAINWLIVTVAKNAFTLYFARFLAGFSTGAMCVLCPMYINEIGEISMRGKLGSIFQMFFNVGILLTYILGSLFNWYHLTFVLILFPVIFLLLFSFMPESPVYLIKKGNVEQAELNLMYFRGANADISLELKDIESDAERKEEKSRKELLLSRSLKKGLICVLGIMAFQQLSGINAVVFYTVPIFKSEGSSLSPETAAILVALISVVMSYVTVLLIEKAGRKFFLVLSSAGMMTCLGVLGLYYQMREAEVSFPGFGILPLISLGLFIVFFSMGYGPIPWMIMGELFGPEVRAIASGVAIMVNWGFVFLVTFCFPLMNANLGGYITFYTFGIIMAGASFFVVVMVPETAGKSTQEVQEELNI